MSHQKIQTRFWLDALLRLSLVAVLLSACSPAQAPLRISNVSISPEPIVGRIVDLQIEIMSTQDEPDVVFAVDSLENQGNKIHIVSGDTSWQGSLVANRPQSFQLSVCVVEEGIWPIEINARRVAEGDKYFDFEIIHLKSSLASGELIREKDYTFSQDEYANRPTAQPATVSSECSGQQN
ncbi:MAG: hypothetical protein ACREBU_11510 [Nitrososphaera sp.]